MATISEIAKRAGVGTTTVSRYLNHHPYISAEKKAKIEAAIIALDYTPSAIATQLRHQTTNNIGVLVSRITNPFFTALFDALERQLHNYGYQVMVMQTYDDEHSERAFLNQIKNKQMDGLILASVENPASVLQVAQEFPKRIVLLNENIADPNIRAIVLNHYQATLDGLNYLHARGCRRIAYATGGDFSQKGHGQERNNAYRDFLAQQHLPENPDWIFQQQHTIADGQHLAQQLQALPKDRRPDAIFTNSDEIAMGLIGALMKAGIRVPEDIAVMGYDDQPMAAYLEVPLTTIHQPIEEMAQAAVYQLLTCLGQTLTDPKPDLTLKLVPRSSA
ncbi:MAG: LacI family transcriptional regulator [Lactobacillus sp.]|jgi:DNA-binding LacI/PurR family transcriptional regulator|nr:LacI family transcriptional regulator [Lactobacillus sp.]